MYYPICKVCGAFDSSYNNGDCGGCTECYSIEQGFLHVREPSDNENKELWDFLGKRDFLIDEDDHIYLDDDDLDEPIACLWEV